MSVLSRARSITATTLHATAGVLGGTARAVDAAAELVRPQPEPSPAEEVARSYAARGTVRPRTQVAVTDTPPARVPTSHIEELAALPASDVIAQIPELSTDELRQLSEYEQRNRRRKTVLAAIESAAEDYAP